MIADSQSQHPEGQMGCTSADPAGVKPRVLSPVLSPAPGGLRDQMHSSPLITLSSIKCTLCCIPWISWFVIHSTRFYNLNLSFCWESFEELHKFHICFIRHLILLCVNVQYSLALIIIICKLSFCCLHFFLLSHSFMKYLLSKDWYMTLGYHILLDIQKD